MKPIIKRLLSFAFLFTLLGFPLVTRGTSIMHLDGYAKLNICFCYKDLVGYTMDISGDTSHNLVVYNTRRKNVEWRRKVSTWLLKTLVTDDGQLLLVDGHSLYQINVLDGKTQNAIDLKTLPWPPTVLPKDRLSKGLEEREKELIKKALSEVEKEELAELRKLKLLLAKQLNWNTAYTLELVSHAALFIHRTRSQTYGCTRNEGTDWILQDLNKNRMLQSGSWATFIGKVSPEEIILFEFPDDNERLLTIGKGGSRDIGKILSSDRPGWSLRYVSQGWHDELLHNQRCLIKFKQQTEFDNNVAIADKEHYALYDNRTGRFTYLSLEPIKEHYTRLVLHSTHVVRYSRHLSFESETNASPLWIESYDLTGKRIAKTTLSGTAQDRHLWFHGRTKEGDLIFEDSISYGGTGAENPYTVTGGVFVVEIPSLKIKATHQLPVIQGGLNIKPVEDTDQIVQVQGNIDLETMKTESQPHQFIVRGLDVYSGKELWRFKEDVVVRKLKDE